MSNPSKKDFVEVISKSAEVSREKANQALNIFLDYISKELAEGKKVVFAELGSFEKIFRPERAGYNPKTREPIKIPARHTVRFKPGKRLKDRMNGEES